MTEAERCRLALDNAIEATVTYVTCAPDDEVAWIVRVAGAELLAARNLLNEQVPA